jgi:VanZ family protein
VRQRQLPLSTRQRLLPRLASRLGQRRLASPHSTAIAVALFVAVVDETRQSLSAARTGTPWDVLLDVAGAALGIWLLHARMSRHA